MPQLKLTPDAKQQLKAMMELPEFEDVIRAQLPSLLQAMFDLAEGVQIHEVKQDPDTKEWVGRVYQRAPDRLAAQFLIENVIGKVPTRVEMTGKDGESLTVIPWAPKLGMIEGQLVEAKEGEVKMLEDARDEQANI